MALINSASESLISDLTAFAVAHELPASEDVSVPGAADDEFMSDTLAGLRANPKRINSKYFYDEKGSALFEQICDLPEYYPTRTELRILRDCAEELAYRLGPDCTLFELGSGSSTKTRILLDHLPQLAAYRPIDISESALSLACEDLERSYPDLTIEPVCADFTQAMGEAVAGDSEKRVAFFPGSTIGNFQPDQAVSLLRSVGEFLGEGGKLILGADLLKDPFVIEKAYNDAAGVTAEFNLNLLERMRRALGADIDASGFRHLAVFNEVERRIEMHLVSTRPQVIRIGEHEFYFEEMESIHTENSYKYSEERLERIGTRAGFALRKMWTDAERHFGVFLFEVMPSAQRGKLRVV